MGTYIKTIGLLAVVVMSVQGAILPRPGSDRPQQVGVCREDFDKEFGKCFSDHGNLDLNHVFSILTQGASGALPGSVDPKEITKKICSNREQIVECTNDVPRKFSDRCPPPEQGMMLTSVQSITQGMAHMCGDHDRVMPPCFSDYDKAFRECLTRANADPENLFKTLSNTAEGTGMTFDELKTSSCRTETERAVLKCTSESMMALAPECTEMERVQVGRQVQQMMMMYRDVCSVCLSGFEHSLSECFSQHENLQIHDVFALVSTMSGAPLPSQINVDDIKSKLCKHRSSIVKCVQDLEREQHEQCTPRDKLFITNTINSNIQSTAGVCGVEAEMPPCLKIFDTQFRECLSGIPLKGDDFFNVIMRKADNDTISNVCDKAHNSKVLMCSHTAMSQMKDPANKCTKMETMQVEGSVKQTLAAYEGTCLSTALPGGIAELVKSGCIQDYTTKLQQCLNIKAHVGMEMIMGLMSSGPAAMLLQVGNKDQLLPRVCGNKEAIFMCIKENEEHMNKKCQPKDTMIMKTTTGMARQLVTKNCKDFTPKEMPMPVCLQHFDKNFRQCMKAKKIEPEQFFMVLANHTDGETTIEELRKKVCAPTVNPEIVQCAMSSLKTYKCSNPAEGRMVQGSVKQSLSQFEGICLSISLPGGLSQLLHSQCIREFSTTFRTCLVETGGIGLETLMSMMSDIGEILPEHNFHTEKDLETKICLKKDSIKTCIEHINDHINAKCEPGEKNMVQGTVDMVENLIGNVCKKNKTDLQTAKEELRNNCERERKEFENRLSSIQQQHKMLKTQNDDLQAEFSKLNMDYQKEKEDQKQVESQRNQEYMQLKQEKELELTSLKDQLANLGREKEQLATEVQSLKTQLQNAQVHNKTA